MQKNKCAQNGAADSETNEPRNDWSTKSPNRRIPKRRTIPMSSASGFGFRKPLKLTTLFAKASSKNYVQRLQNYPESQNKGTKNGAAVDPGGIGWASRPPSGILFENGRGGLLHFGRPLGRLRGPGLPKSLRDRFAPDFLGSYFKPKVGKEASKKAPNNRYRKNVEDNHFFSFT